MSEHVDGTEGGRETGRSTALLERLKAGDEKAYEELVTEYRERVYRVAWRILRDDESAEDAAQEAFIKVFRHIGRFEGRSSLYTWIYRITVNIALNKLKRDRFRQMLPLGDLPRRERRPSADHEGMSHKEIASVMGCSEGTSKANYFHAIRKLRKLLEDLNEDAM